MGNNFTKAFGTTMLANGIEFEFEIVEIGSATTSATHPIELDLNDSYGWFNRIHHTERGVVRTRT